MSKQSVRERGLHQMGPQQACLSGVEVGDRQDQQRNQWERIVIIIINDFTAYTTSTLKD